MTASTPNPNSPRPTPDDPDPEPARPPTPPETPDPEEPPGVPPPAPEPVPTPEPVQIPPQAPPEVPTGPDFPAPTAVRASVLAAALLGCIVAAGPVAAQTSGGDPDVTEEPTDPCQAQPEGQGGSDDDEADGGADRTDDDRRAGLERCNGVLTPPRIGDHEIEEPAPDTGTTPVIPPERVPEQLRR